MKKTDQDYLKLMLVIHTYSNFNENFDSIFYGYMDDENALIILKAVEESFSHGIQDQAYKLIAETLVEEMKINVKRIAEAGSETEEIKAN